MPVRFSEVIKDHKQLKSTIEQIEQLKNRIKNNEKQMFPPQSFTLRNGLDPIGPSDFGEGTAAGDQSSQLNIITVLNGILQSVLTNYLSPYQSLQLWTMVSPRIPNTSATVAEYIDELTAILNGLQTNPKFKPTEQGAIASLLRRIIQSAEQSASPGNPIIVNNFNQINQVNNILSNPNGSNNNLEPPQAVQEIISNASSEAPAGEEGYPSSGEVNGDSNGSSNQPQQELFQEEEEFGTPAANIPEVPSTPFSAMTDRITEVRKSANKAIKASEKENGYAKQIQEALDKAAKAFPQLDKTNAINLMAYVFVGISRNIDVTWVFAENKGVTEAAREQLIRQYNERRKRAVRLFMMYQKVYFEALVREATPGKTPAKIFGRLAEEDTAHPRFIHFLMNDAEGPEYMSPAEILGFIYGDEMPEEDADGLLVEESAGMTPPETPPARVSSVVAETPPSIQQNSARIGAAKRVPGSAPPRMSSMSAAPTPSRIQDNPAAIIATFSPAAARPARDRNPPQRFNPRTGQGLEPVSAGRRTIKSSMEKVNNLFTAIEAGNKSKSVKNQIKSNLEFLLKKGKVSETYLNNVMNKLGKL